MVQDFGHLQGAAASGPAGLAGQLVSCSEPVPLGLPSAQHAKATHKQHGTWWGASAVMKHSLNGGAKFAMHSKVVPHWSRKRWRHHT